MMLMGKPGQDERLLAVARWVDRRTNAAARDPGATAARKAAEAIGGRCILPEFSSIKARYEGDTDFNDMALRCGLTAVANVFAASWASVVPAR
jgi:phage/plasmid primase-like uncharacterized protein